MLEEKEKDLLAEILKERVMLSNTAGDFEQDNDKIELVDFLNLLRKKMLIIILVAVIGAGLAGVYSFFVATPMYESVAKVYVLSQTSAVTSLSDIQLSNELAQDYQEMIYSYPVVVQVIKNLNLDYSYKYVCNNMLEIENPADTRVINIKITSDDPEEAAEMANEFAVVAKRTIADIMKTDEPNIFEHGRASSEPVSPNKARNIVLGFISGALIVVMILFILFVVKDTIRTPEDIQRRLNGNVLAAIPFEDTIKLSGRSNRG